MPESARPALLALWKLDLALSDVVSTTLTTHLGAIRLAWWRERLEDLDKGLAPPAEPRLQAVASELLPRGIRGAELAQLEFCWLALLSPFPWDDDVADALALRGAILFGIGARLLGRDAAEGEALGRFWSLEDGVRHCSDPQSRAFLLNRAKLAMAELPKGRIPLELAPLAGIIARRTFDLMHEGAGKWHRFLSGVRAAIFGVMPWAS